MENLVKEAYEKAGFDVIKKGMPDLTILKDRHIGFIEVKFTFPKLSPAQNRAVTLLREHGFHVSVLRVTGKNDPRIKGSAVGALRTYDFHFPKSTRSFTDPLMIENRTLKKEIAHLRDEIEHLRTLNQVQFFLSLLKKNQELRGKIDELETEIKRLVGLNQILEL